MFSLVPLPCDQHPGCNNLTLAMSAWQYKKVVGGSIYTADNLYLAFPAWEPAVWNSVCLAASTPAGRRSECNE